MFTGAAVSTGKVDSAFFFIVASSAVLLIGVMVVMMIFIVRYRRKRHPEPRDVPESVALEVVWTAIPLLLVLAMFYFGWVDFKFIRTPPKDAMTVDVTARQWSWQFRYPNGKEDDVLRVPLDKPVNLVMTSLDVLHCLFIPAFRIKEDCVPGMKTHLWFQADETGTYEVFCSEYCGAGHSHMRSSVIVLPVKDFDAWYAAAEEAGPAAQGLKVLKAKGCLGCHAVDGVAKVGPSFKGLFGSRVTVVSAGKERTVAADEAYIRTSVLDPNADVAKGFGAVMPKIAVTDDEMKAIIAYLETLK